MTTFKQYLVEAKEVNLIDMVINGKLITKDTPREKWDGDFDCTRKKLTSLFGAPLTVSGGFFCNSDRFTPPLNKLTSLTSAPSSVGGDFNCKGNKLTSVVGAPSTVGGDFECGYNKLTSLIGAPSSVGGDFNCKGNKLTSVVGAPSTIDGDFNCRYNELTTLKDIHKIVKKINGIFYTHNNQNLKSHVLGLLLIDGITEIKLDNQEVEKILNKHLGKGRQSVMDAQQELIDAGYEEYAKL